MNVGIVARVCVDDPPRLSVDDAVRHAAFLLETFRENGNLDSRIRQRGMILNKREIARTVAVSKFCARLDIASR